MMYQSKCSRCLRLYLCLTMKFAVLKKPLILKHLELTSTREINRIEKNGL